MMSPGPGTESAVMPHIHWPSTTWVKWSGPQGVPDPAVTPRTAWSPGDELENGLDGIC